MSASCNNPNIIKCRNDSHPVFFEEVDKDEFKLCSGAECSWVTQEDSFGRNKLRSRIEPWLTALFQSDHLSLLCGSGLSYSIHKISNDNNLATMSMVNFDVFNEQINEAAEATAKLACRGEANIEDQIRVANELLTGLGHYCPPTSTRYGAIKLKKEIGRLNKEIDRILKYFAESILTVERNIALSTKDRKEKALGFLVSFLMSFASRSGTRDRLHVFTTNYDRIIEMGAELAGMHLIDRFVGNLSPMFRSSRLNIDMHYNPPGIRGEPRYVEGVARFTKLHGSIDWVYSIRDIRRFGLPFGAASVSPYIQVPGNSGEIYGNLMIYPNAAKERETSEYPYVELFRDFSAAICRPNNTLVTYGYGFGDEHINRVIKDMLTIPSTHLVIISFSDPADRIKRIYSRVGRASQITLLIGDHLGQIENLVNCYLPKPAIDRASIKMAEILKVRLEIDKEKNDIKDGM